MLIMLLLCIIALAVGGVSGQHSLIDTFTPTPSTHCPAGNIYRYGQVDLDPNQCALLCLEYDDCSYAQWDYPGNAADPCWLRNICDFAHHSTCVTYSRPDAAEAWLTVPDLSLMAGMLATRDANYGGGGGSDHGLMRLMNEDVCAFHCWITDCVGVVFQSGTCYFKAAWGTTLQSAPGMNIHVKAVLAGCVPGYGCYALLTYQTGQNKATARQHCQDAGGQLAVFENQEELDAVKEDGRFAALMLPFWLGVHYTAGQWQGEESGAVVTVLPWLSGQPASTEEAALVTVNPHNSWGYATAAATDTAFPFCELPAITTTTRGQPMSHLNDADVATCFTPQTASEAAGTTLKTAHLGAAASPPQILVKVQGDGLVCSKNVRVWQMVAGGSSNSSGGGIYLSPCQLTGSYTWQEKQLCLFTCACDATHVCSAAFLRMNYATGISVCEFQVL